MLQLQSLEQQLSRDAVISRESLANDLVQVMETVQQPVKSRTAKTGVIFFQSSFCFHPTCNSSLSATVTSETGGRLNKKSEELNRQLLMWITDLSDGMKSLQYV